MPDTLSKDGLLLTDSTFYLVHTGTCKSLVLVPAYLYSVRESTVTGVRIRENRQYAALPAASRKPLLTVHGNVMYDFYYQSNADTPFVEKDIHQHTLQTTLDIMVKEQYPLHLTFSTSKSNAVLLRNITGLNLQYSARDFKHTLLNKAEAWDAGKLRQWKELETLKAQLDNKWDSLNRLKERLSTPLQIQRLVEARERELYGVVKEVVPDFSTKMPLPLKGKGKMRAKKNKADSSFQQVSREYELQKQRLDSLREEVSALERRYRQRMKDYDLKKGNLVDVLLRKSSAKALREQLESMNLPDTVLPKGYKTLLALRSAGIGRTMVDYSELTAKNISIIGAQAELNPSWYFAFASGAVDYRFRDFVVNRSGMRQYLNIVRAGTGMREGNNVILSFYTGKKQAYNFNTTVPGSPEVSVPDNRIMGVSLEGRWQVDQNNYIVAEVAKSSLPLHVREMKEGMAGSMFRFDDHSNEAYAVTAQSFFPASKTRISGMYKLMGANFQSFSLYPSGSRQAGWMVKVDQPFFRQQLTISGSMRKNAFTSIFENASYMSNTVFKSIQATFRKRRWPVVTVGYYPSSQLMKLGEDKFMENMFYTLAGTVSHFYQYRKTSMNTMFSGTRFYNRQADSNFVYFNSTNLLLNQSVFLGRLTVNGGLSSATNQDYALYGADGSAQYRVKTWLELGGGLKYNYQTIYDMRQLGYAANVRVEIPKLGEIRLMADKSFIPGVERQLVPNKTGRVTYTRIF
ncbi:hypothetical protein [Chitinophaga sp. XS-30]|uniref:hypothetical protein n=1 Tax=Chitinophaga sp. XS-30 TaxID=2604421 RepID=UPI0011DD78F6|nr:hypothetical protein [Chitinophaga sp. XS-30]QEH43318.1 hypothetical protein FW415_21625 [Chitinophaga sp. XS-30]